MRRKMFTTTPLVASPYRPGVSGVVFTVDDANRAADTWKFNCGPAAICAVLGLTPDEVRPFLGDFEAKGYTNPTLMYDSLARLGAKWVPMEWPRSARPSPTGFSVPPRPVMGWPKLGLVRIQWEGPWTGHGVPFRARYRQTHWIGARRRTITEGIVQAITPPAEPIDIFDVNCMCVGGWVPLAEWSGQVVPWLLHELYPKANGKWHQTHVLEIQT